MRVPFSFLPEQFSNPEPYFAKIREFLKRCDFTLGEDLEVFEKRYAAYCGTKHAIGVGTGTDAIFLSLKAAGVQPGDEVITAPNSFIATTGAIVQAGAKAVYVDVGEELTLDPGRIERALSKRTRAIVPVHWAGGSADMTSIMEIARRHGLVVVEDACQALGAEWKGRRVGSFGHTGAFSTHPLKPLHVWGDGGVIVTNDDELAKELRLLRNHGLEGRDTVVRYGYNCRFDNLQAIVGNIVMDTLEDTITRRIRHAERYDRAFGRARRAGKHVVHLYQIFESRRDELLAFLHSRGIEAKVHYPTPLHLQPAAAVWGYREGDFPMTERQSRESITLPCHQYLSDEQIDYVIETVTEFHGR